MGQRKVVMESTLLMMEKGRDEFPPAGLQGTKGEQLSRHVCSFAGFCVICGGGYFSELQQTQAKCKIWGSDRRSEATRWG